MRIAFAIVSLFPGGGLQRDCVEIAKLVRGLGHDVTIYTCRLHDHTLAYNIPILLLQNDGGFFDAGGKLRIDDETAIKTLAWYVPLVAGADPLARSLGTTTLEVNSYHHQAADALGRGLRAVAWSPDGVIEGIEAPGRDLSVGIDRLLGATERLVPRGFGGGARVIVDEVAPVATDDRAVVLLWRA